MTAKPRDSRRFRYACLVVIASASLLVTACGSADTPSTSGSPSSLGTPTSGCGSPPTNRPVVDNTGVLEELGSTYTDAYNGFPLPINTSKWSSWKPSKTTGFRIGIAFGPLTNGTQTELYNTMVSTLEESPQVSEVIPLAITGLVVSEQIRDYNSLVQKEVDLIIYQPIQSDAFVDLVNAAGEAGIPSVAVNAQVASDYSVNITSNNYLSGAIGGSELFALLGGKGDVLQVDGVPAASINVTADQGFEDALALCPDIKVAGTVTGGYSTSTAQTATLQFLASHPQGVDGVWEAGSMSIGVSNAFIKLGKPVPPLSANGAPQGFLAYVSANPSYQAAILNQSARAQAKGTVFAVLKMLNGDGVKVSSILLAQPHITRDNLSDWSKSDDTQSQEASLGPDSVDADVQAYISKLFTV